MKFEKMYKALFAAAIIAVGCVVLAQSALALKVLPQRLVIAPGEKIAYVYIKNDSQKEQSYAFSWKELAMTRAGDLTKVTPETQTLVPDYRPVGPYIRYSPRRTTLKPGETQRLTFLVRRSPDMTDGEYRSHFLVANAPKAVPRSEGGKEVKDTKIAVEFLVSRAFPIYLHHGAVDASIALESARMVKSAKKNKMGVYAYHVVFDVTKQGNRSVIGLADVFCGDESMLTVPRLFAVYAEADRRQERALIVKPELANACPTPLRLVIKGHKDDPRAKQVLAEGVISR